MGSSRESSKPPPYHTVVDPSSSRSSRAYRGPDFMTHSPLYRETDPLLGSHNSRVKRDQESDCCDCKIFFTNLLSFLLFVVLALIFLYLYGVCFPDKTELPVPHPYWDQPAPANHCHSYGTREYTARLLNITKAYDRMAWCKTTPIVINEVNLDEPDFCESRGIYIYGHWLVTVREYRCLPYWSQFKDEGCTVRGSGFRRFSARLWNIYPGEDWMKMCSTAPAEINHIFLPGPTYCQSKGIFGMYGIWEIDDASC